MHRSGKVIGVGVPKTGTATLRECFKILGIVPYASHRKDLKQKVKEGDLNEALTEAERYQGLENTPWSMMFRELDQRFPGSKFILTTRRDARTQAMSSWNHHLRKGRVQGEVTPDFLVSQQRSYEWHNAAVREYFKDRPDELLEVCWDKGDGWPQLCEFLDLPVPDVPFPRKNRGRYPTAAGVSSQGRPVPIEHIDKFLRALHSGSLRRALRRSRQRFLRRARSIGSRS